MQKLLPFNHANLPSTDEALSFELRYSKDILEADCLVFHFVWWFHFQFSIPVSFTTRIFHCSNNAVNISLLRTYTIIHFGNYFCNAFCNPFLFKTSMSSCSLPCNRDTQLHWSHALLSSHGLHAAALLGIFLKHDILFMDFYSSLFFLYSFSIPASQLVFRFFALYFSRSFRSFLCPPLFLLMLFVFVKIVFYFQIHFWLPSILHCLLVTLHSLLSIPCSVFVTLYSLTFPHCCHLVAFFPSPSVCCSPFCAVYQLLSIRRFLFFSFCGLLSSYSWLFVVLISSPSFCCLQFVIVNRFSTINANNLLLLNRRSLLLPLYFSSSFHLYLFIKFSFRALFVSLHA